MPAATMRTSTSCSSGASSSISSTRIASPASYNTAVRVFINTCPLSLLLHILVLQGYHQYTEYSPAYMRGGSSVPSTLPTFLDGARKLALVWVRFDFRADALRHGAHPCFGARIAPHSHVLGHARVRPVGAPPHLPRE